MNLEKPGRAGQLPTSTLPRLITFLCPVDDVYSALAPHQLVGAVARAQGSQRVADFHRRVPKKQPARGAGWKRSCDLCPIRERRSTLKPNVRNASARGRQENPSRRRRRVRVRRLSLFARAKPPSPCKDHALGRREKWDRAPFACRRQPGGPEIAKHGNASSLDADATSNFSHRDGDLRLLRFSCSGPRGFSPL